MGEGLWFIGFPVPPSDNAIYYKGRIKSNEYRHFDRQVEAWAWNNKKPIQQAKSLASAKPLLSISILLRMPEASFWTKKKTVKRMDATNRLKASMDALSKLIELDDSYFWDVRIMKSVSVSPPCLDIFMTALPG